MLLLLFAGASVELAPPAGRISARTGELAAALPARPVQAAQAGRADAVAAPSRPAQLAAARRQALPAGAGTRPRQ